MMADFVVDSLDEAYVVGRGRKLVQRNGNLLAVYCLRSLQKFS
jgi:hypothetical protein